MKRFRLLALLLAVMLLLSGCSLLLANRDGYVDMVPFDEMKYERPDLDAVLADADALIEASEADIAAQGFGNVLIDGVIDAKDASGNVIGHVINSTSKDGFGGWVSISTGIQEDGTLNGIAFLSISESAGLGMNARDTDWYKQFTGKKADKFSVTKTGATSDDEINAISGATITSRAVTGAVNAAVYFVNNHLK